MDQAKPTRKEHKQKEISKMKEHKNKQLRDKVLIKK